jgi:hypothetical protein
MAQRWRGFVEKTPALWSNEGTPPVRVSILFKSFLESIVLKQTLGGGKSE